MADPTVTDVFNQLVLVNGKLDQVEVNTSVITNLNVSINTGFTATVGRLDTLAAIEVEAVKLLFHQTKQLDTVICMLDQISRNTCAILTEVAIQTKLQKQMAGDMAVLRYIAASANPAGALELARHAELEAKIEKCCPPEQDEPACRYEPCQRPGTVKQPELPKLPDKPKPVG
jgi:hypothetical protein